jgi:hypothetical protein
VFPDEIIGWALQGKELYLRAGNLVWRVSKGALSDDELETTAVGGENVPFEGYMAWPYLDFGRLGIDKMMEGFDLVIDGNVAVSFGYNQKATSQATDEYVVYGDTLPADMVPMPITAPSFQMRLTFEAGQNWEWFASNIYLNDMNGAAP